MVHAAAPVARRYHDLTAHTPDSVRSGGHTLDWDNKPFPFKVYTELPAIALPRELDPVPIDQRVAEAWASLRVSLRDLGLRMPVNDSWIAATAIALGIPVVTQDADYLNAPGLEVIHV